MERRRPPGVEGTVIVKRRLLLLFRVIVGGVFVWAGVLKIIDPLGFAQSIENYQVVSRVPAFLVALVLPWIEVLSGAFLILGLLRRSSALLISLQLIGFIGLVAFALARGIDTSCGCFGSFSRRADLSLILTDAVLLALALTVLFVKPARHVH
ncbi:MAG: DoxX family protein [Candidatus Aminicenantes bacterium]|nr:DoxX family protein [Candidatus Aminicenantes bacterium]